MSAPRTLKDLVLADLQRAQRLVTKVHPGPIDPQFRIASPEGDGWIAIALTENPKERARRLALVSDFMAWKLSPGLVLATELHEPDAVLSLGLQHGNYAAFIALIELKPVSFSSGKFVLHENMDAAMLAMLPRGARTLTKTRAKELAAWFGADGKFPAVKLAPAQAGTVDFGRGTGGWGRWYPTAARASAFRL